MISKFNDKFRQDLEIIYAKYSHPFDDEPELNLSFCDLPENVKLIESYKYSSCGKWKVLSGNSVCEDDSSLDDECHAEDFSSDEENQYSSYESDGKNSVSSECSESFVLKKSFINKHPRTCVTTSPHSKLTPPPSTTPNDRAKTTQSSRKIHESARKNQPNNNEEDEHRNTNTTLTRNAGSSIAETDSFKLSGTVTMSKDLWSQVQQCLRFMTNVFLQVNRDCADEISDNSLEKPCKRKLTHKERGENSVRSSVVKHKLFHDDGTSKSQATVPMGKVIEQLFVRRKGSKGPGVEHASRQTFLVHSTSKISEVESLDSGFCHEIENSSEVDVFAQGYTSTSSSACRSRINADALPCHITMVSGTSEECCSEPLYLKSPLGSSIKSEHNCQPSSPGRSSLEIRSPKIADEPRTSVNEPRTLVKKGRRRYRLVRRRTSSCTTQQTLTNDTATSEHEHESDTQFQKTRARKERIFDNGLPASDTENFNIYAKTKNTTSDVDKQSACCNSPDLDEVILVKAPHTPALTQVTATPPESSLGNSRSSTPRKQIYSRVNNTATNLLDLDTYLRKSDCKKHKSTHVDSIPSPIKSVLSPNIHQTENWLRSCESFISNDDCFCLSSSKLQSVSKNSLPGTSKHPTPCPILQPEISIDLIRKKDIPNRFVYDEGELNTQNSGRSCKTQNYCRYPKTLFASSPSSTKRRCPSPTHHPANHRSKQTRNVQKESLPNDPSEKDQQVNLIASAFNVDTKSRRSPKVFCHPTPYSDQQQSKSRSERCTARKVLISPNTHIILSNLKGSLTMAESSNNMERKGKHATSDKLDRHDHDSETLTSPVPSQNQRRFLQQKTTPRRAKFHPYADCSKFRRSPSLSYTFQDLTVKSPTPSCNTQRWTTLDRSPVAICVAKARRMSDSVSAPRKILDFSSNERRLSPKIKENSFSCTKMSNTTESDRRIEDDISSDCSSGKCTKMFCFNCSMDLS